MALSEEKNKQNEGVQKPTPPSISLPKGGGAIRGIGEKFAANPVTGTGSMTVPIATSPGRSGFGPQLSLAYDSGSGNGPFGFGWSLALPSITRKTDKGLPEYRDAEESDEFILSGAEDLVPVLESDGSRFEDNTTEPGYTIHRYRPRIEGLFARIERWTKLETGEIHWRSITRDNITTLYGKDNNSRIFDPNDSDPDHPTRIFSWLICESYDDKGNAIIYEYEKENKNGVDTSQAHEKNRTDDTRSANRYLKRIKYGNKTSRLIQPDFSKMDWLFEVVFDYDDDHYEELPLDPTIPEREQHQYIRANIEGAQNEDGRIWPVRQDPFSSYRAGFEVRTYRLCHRALMFHHFPDELGMDDYLVRSTEFTYDQSPIASFITSVTQSGYQYNQDHGKYLKKSLPPLEFEYSKAVVNEDIKEIDSESLENLPTGLDGSTYQWVDLDGEGISGILTEQADAWYYKRNLSPINRVQDDDTEGVEACFAPIELVGPKPNATLASGRAQFMDLASDGQLDLVALASPSPGFYERTHDKKWEAFKPFISLPHIPWNDPNLRFVDLNGDGHADILITEDEAFIWYLSLAETGFAAGERVRQALDEDKGPKLVFADGTQSIYLADISGDGLSDLVRIRNGEVCYWPNLGYGRFGAKVTMDNSPHFDVPDQFDQRRIRLADIDGSGVTDIIYLKGDGVYIYLNESGNRWADAEKLKSFPKIDNLASVIAVDLLGNGTACLVWSSPLPSANGKPMRYIDLMGGQKPHLLVKTVNNLGAETHIHYAPSTKFYLADKEAGKPWITRIPFPVHVVERVETYDRISGNCFVTRYAYHHGYFDGVEREFRGFGKVEQWDTEEFAALNAEGELPVGTNVEESSHVPPVHTRTWFHTGTYLGRNHVSNFFAGLLDANDIGEYYREPGLTNEQAQELLLEDTVLPDDLTVEEEREACRALKGAMLRQEVYALDGTDKEQHPYTVTEQNFTIRRLQPEEDNRHSVFFTHARESINYHYERNPADPRIAHNITLEVDDFGNVLKEVAIGYGRRGTIRVVDDEGEVDEIPNPALEELDPEDQAKQTWTLVTYTENHFTNDIEADDDYRTPLPCEPRTYELTGYTPTGDAGRFQISDFVQPDPADPSRRKQIHIFDGEVDYEDAPPNGTQRRLIEQTRTLYYENDLSGPLPLGEVESLAIPYENYQLAFTPGLLNKVFGSRIDDNLLREEGGYLRSEDHKAQGFFPAEDPDTIWWVPSGRSVYPSMEAAQEHFYLPAGFQDPFGNTTSVTYDHYDLLLIRTEDPDPIRNIVEAKNNYRTMQPWEVTGPNGNRSQVAFDSLGMVVGTALMGKEDENKGDSLDGFISDLDPDIIRAHVDQPLKNPHAILQQATTRLVYDIFRYSDTKDEEQPQPNVIYTLARETHVSDQAPGEATKIQHSFLYFDGLGREIQSKIQAEPGPTPARHPDTGKLIIEDGKVQWTSEDTDPRWVGTGRTIYDNKGNPIKKYEPFFSDTHQYEDEDELVHWGVTPILRYDPLSRLIRTDNPNGTYSKVAFDAWQQSTWDENDTVVEKDEAGVIIAETPWYSEHNSAVGDPQKQHAAVLAAKHAGTPAIAHLDVLGRTFLSIEKNTVLNEQGEVVDIVDYQTRIKLDIEGNTLCITDARANRVMSYMVCHVKEDGTEELIPAYDIAGRQLYQNSMDAGERWMLINTVESPIRTWDSRDFTRKIHYDELQRPINLFVQKEAETEFLAEHTEYGEGHPDATALNLRGKIYRQHDGAGIVTNDAYDFKGNLLRSTRQLILRNYRESPDWSLSPDLEDETFTSSTVYDALNRPIQVITPHNSATAKPNVIQPTFNEANLLEKVDVWLRQSAEPDGLLTPDTAELHPVLDIDYNAKGQREMIEYGNDVRTTYEYDPLTFRLIHLKTLRESDNDTLQNLYYTYDPVGNITGIIDNAQQTIFFNNAIVEPSAQYEYDALYRVIRAEGREHAGQNGNIQRDHTELPYMNMPHANDAQAMRRYTERYEYDQVGNIMQIIHNAGNGGWTRHYEYEEDNNRLRSTSLPGDNPAGPYSAQYEYDNHGNMKCMPHLPDISWDFKDQMQRVDLGGGGVAYYLYDSAGQRVRKVVERPGSLIEERIYLGGYEIFRKHEQNDKKLERETLHIMDDEKRIALVETKTYDDGEEVSSPTFLIRYQIDNHLGSACLELDNEARLISYEEYYPFGNTSYNATNNAIEASLKRYRYTGKEKDEETGLYYYGARYYASWLGRWVSCDPAGIREGPNLYQYSQNNPIIMIDPNGQADTVFENLPFGIQLTSVELKGVQSLYGKSSFSLADWQEVMNPIYERDKLTAILVGEIFRSKFYFRPEEKIAKWQRWGWKPEEITYAEGQEYDPGGGEYKKKRNVDLSEEGISNMGYVSLGVTGVIVAVPVVTAAAPAAGAAGIWGKGVASTAVTGFSTASATAGAWIAAHFPRLTTAVTEISAAMAGESIPSASGTRAAQMAGLKAGAKRAAEFGQYWSRASLKKAIQRHAGENFTTWVTDTGKRIFENPSTGRQVIYDIKGGYFRIFQPRRIGEKGTNLNMMGREVRPAMHTKGGAINNVYLKSVDKGAWQAETHFWAE